MPLLHFHLVENAWTSAEIQTLLDIAYDTTLTAFGAPQGDRYQIVSKHPANELILGDTGLGFTRSNRRVVLSIRTRPRTAAQKRQFYQLLSDRYAEALKLDRQDLMINLVTNTDEDWSFHAGHAEFLDGEL
ncbi:tautomerase family protein [Lacticaseibacillus brantae]|nr:tautomerase family protein [Lacticaseibacillus brantae]